MNVNASLKVPEGKLIKLQAEIEDKEVIDTQIRGDFFIEPPEKLHELEEKISGSKTDDSLESIVKELEEVDAELIGFSREDLAKALKNAIEGDEE